MTLPFTPSSWCRNSISTHTPLAGRDGSSLIYNSDIAISTHTPLAGRDAAAQEAIYNAGIISTHTPLAGRDQFRGKIEHLSFISTHTPLAGRDKKLYTA